MRLTLALLAAANVAALALAPHFPVLVPSRAPCAAAPSPQTGTPSRPDTIAARRALPPVSHRQP